MSLGTRDDTKPLVGQGKGGTTLTPGDERIVIPDAGRVKLRIVHAGADGTGWVWLAFDETAEEGDGLYLAPGGNFGEYVSGDIHAVLAADSSADVRLTWQPFGAGDE